MAHGLHGEVPPVRVPCVPTQETMAEYVFELSEHTDTTVYYGVNNRNLGTFETSVDNSFHLAALLPPGATKVSESGISSADTVARLRRAGFSGFLIGETFMKCNEPGPALGRFINDIENRQRLER